MLTDNLVSYWKLDGNSSDAVGSNNGSDTDITYSAGNGKIVQGAGFNGTSSKIDLGTSDSLKITGAFTISAWVKTNGYQTRFTTIFYKIHDAFHSEAYWLGFWTASSNKVVVGLYDGSGFVTCESVDEITDGQFVHVVGVYDGTYLRIYINGSENNSNNIGSKTISYSGDYNAFIGQEKNLRFMDGAIDEVGIWSRALSSTEVGQLYNSGNGLAYPLSVNKTASYSPISILMSTPSMAPTFLAVVTAAFNALSVVATIPNMAASWVYETSASFNPILILINIPNIITKKIQTLLKPIGKISNYKVKAGIINNKIRATISSFKPKGQ